MIKDAIAKVIQGQNLTQPEAEAAMNDIMAGEATQAQIGAYLIALRMKGETVDEITGSARWKYSWVEVRWNPETDTWDTVSGGRSGTTSTGYALTRNGQFNIDKQGYIITSLGDRLMGYQEVEPASGEAPGRRALNSSVWSVCSMGILVAGWHQVSPGGAVWNILAQMEILCRRLPNGLADLLIGRACSSSPRPQSAPKCNGLPPYWPRGWRTQRRAVPAGSTPTVR